MIKYRFHEVVVFCIVVQTLLSCEDPVLLNRECIALGQITQRGVVYESLDRSRSTQLVPVASDRFAEIAKENESSVSWSPGDSGAWVAVVSMRPSQDAIVFNEKGQSTWVTRLPFRLRSMLGVSMDGRVIAALGKVNNEEYLWHVDSQEVRQMWKVAMREQYSSRNQVGWLGSQRNVFSDGEWIMICDPALGKGCQRAIKGEFPAVSPDGRKIALLGDSKTVVVFDVETSRVLSRLVSRFEWAYESPKWCPTSACMVLNEATKQSSQVVRIDLAGRRARYTRDTNGRNMSHVGVVSMKCK